MRIHPILAVVPSQISEELKCVFAEECSLGRHFSPRINRNSAYTIPNGRQFDYAVRLAGVVLACHTILQTKVK
jgi:hypothetical protein